MYLNIGNDMMLRQKSVLGIFDLDNTSTTLHTPMLVSLHPEE